MKSLLKISGLVTFILTEYFICPFFLHFSQKKVLMKFTSSTPFIIEPKVLDGVSFNLNQDEITCITGVNGTGKTTLMNAIMACYRLKKAAFV